jgi:tetratricopeptide (TPR) repeat protein
MGRKRSGGWKQIYLFFAVLIFLSPMACSLNRASRGILDKTGDEAREHLVLGRKYLAEGNYGSALKEIEKVMSLAGKNTPADESLFYTGVIYAHPANPARDYGKSLISFKHLINDYPNSSLLEPAKTVMGLLQENDKLNRTIDRLNNIIIDLRKVDIDIEQKKQEKAKPGKEIMGLLQENDKLNQTVDRLNSIIDELRKVDIDVEQKKRERIK